MSILEAVRFSVTVTYYDYNGTAYPSTPFTLAAHAIAPIYQGSTIASSGFPTTTLLSGFTGSATVSATGSGVVMLVNVLGQTLASGAAQSGTYAAAAGGNSLVGLPSVANNGSNGFTTGATILNTVAESISATVQYYQTDGTSVKWATNYLDFAARQLCSLSG